MKRKILAILVCTFGLAPMALAKGKLDLMAGYFSLQAKTAQKSGSISTLGAYQINYRYGLTNRLECAVGYSLILSETISGDMGFGPDIGLVYFPFNSAPPNEASTDNVNFRSFELYKPYVAMTFHQRQYQSVQSSYAGFGFGGGIEVYWKNNVSVNTRVRYISAGGPDSASSTELDLMSGLTYAY
jgi:hypothetical protein